MNVETKAWVTDADRTRLERLVGALRGARATSGEPYESGARAIEARVGRATTIPARSVRGDVVTMNSRVRLRDLQAKRESVVTLAYPQDANPWKPTASVLGPLGVALLGAREGELLTIQTRRGPRQWAVDQVMYQPEAAGDFEL